ncbi:hypothetical protein C8Q79DRAFT_1004807 [Trametes meyenii]|nr:hypothetical protein C8Q79DRAFT_1004807 [Trametes meyenii]
MAPFASLLASVLDRFKTGIGSWLVGTFLATLLVGMLLQQTFRYFRLYPEDPKYMKIWVVTAVALQLFTSALTMHTTYYYLVTYYLNPLVFTKPDVWTSANVPIFAALSTLVSESFFARRVYMRRQYRIVTVIAMSMVLASCGLFFAKTAQALSQPDLITSANTGHVWIPIAGSALLLAGDLQLTSVLVYFLHKSRTGVKRTDSMVDLLIAYSVSSGSLICILNVVGLILSVAFEHNIVYTASTLVVQAVYTNSFVVALNTRQFVRTRGELDHSDLGGGLVLGEKPSGTAINQVAFPSIVFAAEPSQSQTSEAEISDQTATHREGGVQNLKVAEGGWKYVGGGQMVTTV